MTQQYDTAAMRTQANSIRTQNDTLRKQITQLQTLVDQMKGAWKDNAQVKFAQQFASMQPKLDSFCTNVDSFAARVIAKADEVDAAEGVI